MKKITIVGLLILMVNSCFTADSSAEIASLISLDRIIKNEKKIEALLKNRVYYRNAFVATKVVMGAVAAVQTAANVFNTAVWLFGNSQQDSNLTHMPQAPESRKEWLAKNVLLLFGSLGFYYLFAKTEHEYGSAADIRWFATVRSPFYITLRELYFLAQEASVAKDSPQFIIEMKERLTKLVDQTEQIIAFMRYKKEKLPEKRKLDAQYALNHLLERIEPLYNDIAHAIATDAYNVTYHLDSVLMILEGDCARFARAEGSYWINPSAVLDMMHNMV